MVKPYGKNKTTEVTKKDEVIKGEEIKQEIVEDVKEEEEVIVEPEKTIEEEKAVEVIKEGDALKELDENPEDNKIDTVNEVVEELVKEEVVDTSKLTEDEKKQYAIFNYIKIAREFIWIVMVFVLHYTHPELIEQNFIILTSLMVLFTITDYKKTLLQKLLTTPTLVYTAILLGMILGYVKVLSLPLVIVISALSGVKSIKIFMAELLKKKIKTN